MKPNFVILLILVAVGLVGINAFLFSRLRSTPSTSQIKPGSTMQTLPPAGGATSRPERMITPQELPVADDRTKWPIYTNSDFGYTIEHEPDFKVEKRGAVGGLQDLTAFNYTQDKTVTVVKIEVRNEPAKDTTRVTSEKGRDGNGNDVLVYSYPYKNTQSIVLVGTIYPNVGGDFRFEEVITRMAQSLKIQ